MQVMNSDEKYGAVAKLFHWTIAFMILGLIPVGLGMGMMENSPLKLEVYALHKSFGLLVFFLGIARLVWRFITPAPDHLPSHKRWEQMLAKASHAWLYVCIFGMPLSGWLMSSAGEFPVPFFGLQMPDIIGKDEQLGDLFFLVHQVLAYTLLFILALHIAGALKHHFIDRDETLQRMTWGKAGKIAVIILIIEVGGIYALSGATIIRKNFITAPGEEAQKKLQEAPPGLAAPNYNVPGEKTPGKDGWAIVQGPTKVEFKASLYKTEFTAMTGDVTGDITFNPDDLENAIVKIRVGTKALYSGDQERDNTMKGKEWLDSENYPDIWFVADEFERGEGDNYVAIGTLNIRGKTLPLILPFTLDLSNKKAHMTGSVNLNRLDFDIGAGNWADEGTVSHMVTIMVDLTAVQ